MHLLIDRLFQAEDDLPVQNSNMFHVRLSLILSIVVHMKNSLVRYLDYEAKEAEHDNRSAKPMGGKSALTTPAKSLIYSDIYLEPPEMEEP